VSEALAFRPSQPGESLAAQLAKRVAKEMILRYKIKRNETKKKFEQQGYRVYFAHELVQCRLQTEFAELMREVDLAHSFEPALMVGEIVEAGVEKYLSDLGFQRCDRPYIRFLDNVVVIGSPDYVDNPEAPTKVLDVKFKRRDPQALSHHVARMRIYLWLTKAKQAFLLYISPEGIKDYLIEEPFNDNEVMTLISKPRSPLFEWECRYCAYSSFCGFMKQVEVK